MSLDIWLTVEDKVIPNLSSGIFIRENGGTREISLEEWSDRFPDREPAVLNQEQEATNEVFSANITHNLRAMAEAAGIVHLWEYYNVEGEFTADKLVEQLSVGIKRMKANPDYYKQFNASNGWGTYDSFVPWLERLLLACITYPEAKVSVST